LLSAPSGNILTRLTSLSEREAEYSKSKAPELNTSKTNTSKTSTSKTNTSITNTWKLQDAKARFSELVRKARTGMPQTVTLHGKDAVLVVDAERYEIRPKPRRARTMADFVAGSQKYRGVLAGVRLERATGNLAHRRIAFDEDDA
jgi:antitoxin Phd